MRSLPTFSASTIPGAGRGRRIGTPTINLDLADVPSSLSEGVHACFARWGETWHPAVLFFGPRTVFDGSRACEVHVLDEEVGDEGTKLSVAIIRKIRDVEDFPSVAALKERIQTDIVQARAILSTHVPPPPSQTGAS